MTNNTHDFEVTLEEFEYLQQLALQDEAIGQLLRLQKRSSIRRLTIPLSNAQVEELRDRLTKQLAEIGFDENYSPNEQGQMLERLIDRFHLAKHRAT